MMNAVPEFTKAHATLLSRFLAAPERPEGTMTYPQFAGFVFAVACAPELVRPSEWLPLVFDDQEPDYETMDEAQDVLAAMMALYNECNRQGVEGSAALPPGCEIRSKPLDNLDADAPLSQWARGFAAGFGYLEETWNEHLPAELDQELGAILMALSFFATPALADTFVAEAKGATSLERLAETVVRVFPDAMLGYAHMGRAIYQALLESGAPDLDPVERPKVGRNEPCPCGSGKKFKKCCGAAWPGPLAGTRGSA